MMNFYEQNMFSTQKPFDKLCYKCREIYSVKNNVEVLEKWVPTIYCTITWLLTWRGFTAFKNTWTHIYRGLLKVYFFSVCRNQIIEPTASASYLTTLRKQPSVSGADKLTLVNSRVSKFTFQQDRRCRLCCVYYRSLAQNPLSKLTIFSNNVQ